MSEPEETVDVADGVAARLAAAQGLLRVEDDDAWASPVVDRLLRGSDLDQRDQRFAANLIFSTLRWEGTLDWVLAQAVNRPLEQVEPALLVVLRMATWELLHGAAPDHAAVNAAVEVARTTIGARATGFVNGVLRGVLRLLSDLEWPATDTAEGLALELGYPTWVVEAASEAFGPDRMRAVLEAGNTPAPLILRAVAPREEVLAALAADDIDAEPGRLSEHAVVLGSRRDPSTLAVISEGKAIVQDQASQVVGGTAAAGIAPGSIAIDLCAAPGGKATHLAQQGLTVTAVDRHAGRLRRVMDMAVTLKLPIRTRRGDGGDSGLEPGSADLVLVDAPCTGLGVVRRRPELRWRRKPEDVIALAAEQARLLAAAVELAKPGARVVYSVCTWTVEETDQVVEQVLRDGRARVAEQPAVGTPTRHGVQLAPDIDDGDGMYLCVLTVAAEGDGT